MVDSYREYSRQDQHGGRPEDINDEGVTKSGECCPALCPLR